jgi:hypothetical protein
MHKALSFVHEITHDQFKVPHHDEQQQNLLLLASFRTLAASKKGKHLALWKSLQFPAIF